jgi:hypothetical protein
MALRRRRFRRYARGQGYGYDDLNRNPQIIRTANIGGSVDPRELAALRVQSEEGEINRALDFAEVYQNSPIGQLSGAEYVPFLQEAALAKAGPGLSGRTANTPKLADALLNAKRIADLLEGDTFNALGPDGQPDPRMGELRRILEAQLTGQFQPFDQASRPSWLRGLEQDLASLEGGLDFGEDSLVGRTIRR